MMIGRLTLFLTILAAVAGCERAAPTSDETRLTSETLLRSNSRPPTSRLITPPAAKLPLTEPPKLLIDEQLREGWIALFDGKTLFGWTANSDADWSVKGGEIVCADGPPGLLLTTTRFQDYELACEVWLEEGGNSGLFLRTVTHPKSPAKDCLEFNLCDGHDSYPTGSLAAREKAEVSPDIEGEWHRVKIVLDGESLSAEIDGQPVLQTSSSELATTGGGHIGLQQNGGEVRFRNVFLKPLNLEPLMDGQSLSGWREVPGSEAEVTAESGEVHLAGAGYLESRETFDDFVLQFDARLNAADVNSGLFFRAEEATKENPSNGYELQLQNTVADGDRTKPADYGEGFGTGAIFRRQKARYVNASDEEWFSATLVADGNHFASWVNGLQVTDLYDEREPDPNPRKGRRDEAGHLSLQGHDPATDASFRNMRLAELRFDNKED